MGKSARAMPTNKRLKELLGVPKPPKRQKMVKGRPKGLIAELCNQYVRDIPDVDDEVLLEYWQFFSKQTFKAFRNSLSGPRHYQVWRTRPSGQMCTRLEAIKKLGLYVPTDTAHQGKFAFGHIYEAWAKTVALLAGAKIHSFNMNVTIPIHGTCPVCKKEGWCSCGEIDCLLDVGKDTWLVDVKSASGVSFKHITADYNDKWGYFPQQRAYAESKELKGKIKGALLLFVSKDTAADFKEVIVPLKPNFLEEWYRHCDALVNCLSIADLPERPKWASIRDKKFKKEGITVEVFEDIRCSYCDAKTECWGGKWEQRGGDGEWFRRR